MGVLFSRLRKKKETTEILEELDVEIKNCINFRLENQESQRRWVGRLTAWGIISYILIALLYYLIYFPVGWVSRSVNHSFLNSVAGPTTTLTSKLRPVVGRVECKGHTVELRCKGPSRKGNPSIGEMIFGSRNSKRLR